MNIPETLHEIILKSPLYKKHEYDGRIPRTSLPDMPPINYFCNGKCKSVQTFAIFTVDNGQEHDYHDNMQHHAALATIGVRRSASVLTTGTKIYHITLRCLKCKAYKIDFVLSFMESPAKKNGDVGKTIIQKIGQFPPLEDTIDSDIEKWLSTTDSELFKKGLRSEANGFGIGAFGYFRRIVENNIQGILDEISDDSDSQELKDAITLAKKQHNATERLELVKDHAPQSFMADGQNVFTIIYAALSKGLHAGSDEDCLNAATNIRVCLLFLIKKISVAKQEKQILSNAIKGLTQPKIATADEPPKV